MASANSVTRPHLTCPAVTLLPRRPSTSALRAAQRSSSRPTTACLSASCRDSCATSASSSALRDTSLHSGTQQRLVDKY